jgi:hypothetical protein
MHNAPTVEFPVGRFVWGPWVISGLAVVSAIGLLLWQAHSGLEAAPLWVGAGWVMILVLACLVWQREALREGVLVWTGQAWLWRSAQDHAHPVQLAVLADAGFALLLQVAITDGAPGLSRRVAWLECTDMPSRWHNFRCAVFARPSAR